MAVVMMEDIRSPEALAKHSTRRTKELVGHVNIGLSVRYLVDGIIWKLSV